MTEGIYRKSHLAKLKSRDAPGTLKSAGFHAAVPSDETIEQLRAREIACLDELYRVCQEHATVDPSKKRRNHAKRLLSQITAQRYLWAGSSHDDEEQEQENARHKTDRF